MDGWMDGWMNGWRSDEWIELRTYCVPITPNKVAFICVY